MIKKFKVSYLKTVTSGFNTGKCISDNEYRQIGYWKGCDAVRQTKQKNYLVVAGSTTVGNSQCFAEHIYEILEAPQGLDITGLNFNDYGEDYSLQFRGGVGNIIFSNQPELVV